MITLKNISKSFYQNPYKLLIGSHSNKINILKNIDLHIKFGDIVKLSEKWIRKTTLLRIIAGIISHDNGELRRQNTHLNEIYLVSNNERSFFWRLSVEENMKYFLTLANIKFNEKLIMEFLEIFGLNDIFKKIYAFINRPKKINAYT